MRPTDGHDHYAIGVPGCFHLARETRDSRTLDRVMANVVGAFEEIVREFPTQWFQFEPFWRAEGLMATVASHKEPSVERLRA